RRARIVEIDSLERGRETVRVTLAADFPVGDDVEAGLFLHADGQYRRVVLRLGQVGFRHAPQLARPHARRESPGEFLPVDEPFRLRHAAHQRGGKEFAFRGAHAVARRCAAPSWLAGQCRLSLTAERIAAPCWSSSGAALTACARSPSNCNGGRTASRPPCSAPCAGTMSPRCLTCGSSTTASMPLMGAKGTSLALSRSHHSRCGRPRNR